MARKQLVAALAPAAPARFRVTSGPGSRVESGDPAAPVEQRHGHAPTLAAAARRRGETFLLTGYRAVPPLRWNHAPPRGRPRRPRPGAPGTRNLVLAGGFLLAA